MQEHVVPVATLCFLHCLIIIFRVKSFAFALPPSQGLVTVGGKVKGAIDDDRTCQNNASSLPNPPAELLQLLVGKVKKAESRLLGK
jgi:hypothetical protein